MNRNAFLLVVLALCAAANSGCSSASSDAENICRIATELRGDPALEAHPDLRRTTIGSQVGQLNLTEATAHAFEAMEAVSPSHRYEYLQTSFEEQGVHGWECPAMRDQLAEDE